MCFRDGGNDGGNGEQGGGGVLPSEDGTRDISGDELEEYSPSNHL